MAEKEEAAAMNVVGARFAYDIDDARTGASHFGGEAVGDDLEFLNAILRKIRQSAANDFVVVISAVHGDVATPAECPGGRYFKGVGLGGVEVGCRPVPGQQVSQLQEIAPVQWNTRHSLGRDLSLHLRLSQLDGGRAAIDHYHFPDLLQAEWGIEGYGSPDFEIDILIFAD